MEFTKTQYRYSDFIKENLFQDNWRNYKEDTDLISDNPDKNSTDVSQEVMKFFNVTDPSTLLFTSNDIAFGEDYLFFADIISGLEPKSTKAVNMSGDIAYINSYEHDGHPIVMVNIKSADGARYSHVFIKNEDYDYFDPVKEEENEEDKSKEENKDESSENSEGGQTKEGTEGGQAQEDAGGQDDSGLGSDIKV